MATSPRLAAKHIAFSIRGSAGPKPCPPEKSLPAMNTRTGRLAPGAVCAVATSRTFLSSSAYFTPRVNVTPAEHSEAAVCGPSGVGTPEGSGAADGPSDSPASTRSFASDDRGIGRPTAVASAIDSKVLDSQVTTPFIRNTFRFNLAAPTECLMRR